MDVLLKILGMLISVASPELRKMLEEWILEFEAKAKETDNPWDDMLAAVLKAIIVG